MKHFTLLSLLSTILCLSACDKKEQVTTQTPPPTTQSESQKTQQNPNIPTYLVGSEISYEPFSFKDEMGSPIGFEVDLLNAIGQAEGFNINFIDMPRTQVERTLNEDKFVIWASAISVSAERKEKMDFSDPYIDFVREVYILDTPANNGIQTVADLKDKIIAVNKNSQSAMTKAEELTGSQQSVLGVNTFYLSLASTYQGKAVGTLGDSRILQYYQTKHPEIKTRIISLNEEKKDIAFAVKKGNHEVLQKINQGLAKIKADGTYDKLVKKWFGVV